MLVKIEFSRQILKKYSNIKLHENPFSGPELLLFHAHIRKEGPTDKRANGMTKLIVVFRIIYTTK